MGNEDLYLQVMRDYFEYNALADDAMDAFKEAAPDAFKDFCKYQITSSYHFSEFIDQLYYFADYDKEMLDLTLELYGDKVDEEDMRNTATAVLYMPATTSFSVQSIRTRAGFRSISTPNRQKSFTRPTRTSRLKL